MGEIDQNPAFTTTQWTVVLNARDDSPQAAEALGRLCARYWYPLYAFVRHRGYSKEEAEDLTQEFFKRLLSGNFLNLADPARGRFRAFLLTAIKNFLVNEWEKLRAQKRGGGTAIFVPLETIDLEARYCRDMASEQTPDRLYDRRWALTVIEQAFARIREEFKGEKAEWFDSVKPLLLGDQPDGTYKSLAGKLGTNEGALKVAVHRLRQRFGVSLRQIIAETLSNPGDADAEVAELIAALG